MSFFFLYIKSVPVWSSFFPLFGLGFVSLGFTKWKKKKEGKEKNVGPKCGILFTHKHTFRVRISYRHTVYS